MQVCRYVCKEAKAHPGLWRQEDGWRYVCAYISRLLVVNTMNQVGM